jgi:hypothetical protein
MNVIEHPSAVDPTTLANQIEAWFTDHKFVTELSVSGNSAELLARRKNPARTAIGASRGIAVAIDASDDGTRIEIRAAEWKRNLIGPAVLAISTFGASALVPGWSRVLQKQLEHYVRSLLGPAEGPSELAIVEVIEGQRSERPIGDDVRTLDNSGSSSVLSRDLKITKRWSQTCSIDIEQTNTRGSSRELLLHQLASISGDISETVRKHYSMTSETEEIFEDGIALSVPAHTAVQLTVQWKRLLQHGVVRLVDRRTNIIYEVPYESAVGLTFDQKQIDLAPPSDT